jgi:hypothetical protein
MLGGRSGSQVLGYGIGTVQILSGKINKSQTGHGIQGVL